MATNDLAFLLVAGMIGIMLFGVLQLGIRFLLLAFNYRGSRNRAVAEAADYRAPPE